LRDVAGRLVEVGGLVGDRRPGLGGRGGVGQAVGLVVVVEGLLGEVAGGAVGVLVGLVELGGGGLVDVVPAVDGAADGGGGVEGVVGVGDGLLRQFDGGWYGVGV